MSYSLIFLQTEAFISPRYVLTAVVILWGLILVLLIVILFILIWKNRKSLHQKQLQHQFQDWLVGIVLAEGKEAAAPFEIPAKIQALLKQSYAREQLLQQLIQLKSSINGQPATNLEALYCQLQLSRLSARHLQTNQWNRIAKGIQELAVMNQVDFAGQIFPFTSHRHPVVRMEAQTALVHLQQYQGLDFFKNLRYPLTQWHQVKLLHLLASQPIPSDQTINYWLQSPNASVVQFTLKLIGEQHAATFHDQVIACLHDRDEIVRRQAIACLGEIPSAAANEVLRQQYSQETDENLQMNILALLHRAGIGGDLAVHQPLIPESAASPNRVKPGINGKASSSHNNRAFYKSARRKKLIKA